MSKPTKRKPSAGVAHLSVYDGRTFIGRIVNRGDECRAWSADDKALGSFPNVKAAAQAINGLYAKTRVAS